MNFCTSTDIRFTISPTCTELSAQCSTYIQLLCEVHQNSKLISHRALFLRSSGDAEGLPVERGNQGGAHLHPDDEHPLKVLGHQQRLQCHRTEQQSAIEKTPEIIIISFFISVTSIVNIYFRLKYKRSTVIVLRSASVSVHAGHLLSGVGGLLCYVIISD